MDSKVLTRLLEQVKKYLEYLDNNITSICQDIWGNSSEHFIKKYDEQRCAEKGISYLYALDLCNKRNLLYHVIEQLKLKVSYDELFEGIDFIFWLVSYYGSGLFYNFIGKSPVTSTNETKFVDILLSVNSYLRYNLYTEYKKVVPFIDYS